MTWNVEWYGMISFWLLQQFPILNPFLVVNIDLLSHKWNVFHSANTLKYVRTRVCLLAPQGPLCRHSFAVIERASKYCNQKMRWESPGMCTYVVQDRSQCLPLFLDSNYFLLVWSLLVSFSLCWQQLEVLRTYFWLNMLNWAPFNIIHSYILVHYSLVFFYAYLTYYNS